MKKVIPVKMKSGKAIQAMVRSGEIKHDGGSDSGEYSRYRWEENSIVRMMGLWFNQPGSDYLVVDHPNVISKREYENTKIFFEDE